MFCGELEIALVGPKAKSGGTLYGAITGLGSRRRGRLSHAFACGDQTATNSAALLEGSSARTRPPERKQELWQALRCIKPPPISLNTYSFVELPPLTASCLQILIVKDF
jgi:hypothetical protein